MIVYRLVSNEEFNLILNDNKEELARNASKGKKWKNTHRYKKGVRYIHFFKDKKDIEYFKNTRAIIAFPIKYYICEFDIPAIELLGHKGIGEYEDPEDFQRVYRVEEYAIDINKFKTQWIKSYQEITIEPLTKSNQNNDEIDWNCVF